MGIIVALCCLPVALARGADLAPPPQISAADLASDFEVLKHVYEQLHPGLYRYNTPEQMAANFAALRGQLNHDQTLSEAYLAFSIFLAKIRCGHTYANFFNQPEDVARCLLQPPSRVPFCFRWLDRRMVITQNFSHDPRLAPGTEIISLNGTAVAEVLDCLMTIARADGSNDAKRINYLEVHGDSRYEAFDIYYPLFFLPPSSDVPLELSVRSLSSGAASTLRVPWQTYAQRLAAIQQSVGRDDDDRPLWSLTYPDTRTACLRMPTWATFNSKWDWKRYLDESFDQFAARKTANLILDLRGNEGGADQGEYLLSKIVSRDLPLENFQRLVRYRKVPDDLAPYLKTWDKSFRDWGDLATPRGDDFYVLHRSEDAEGKDLIHAGARPFTGRIFVLVDASNSSATFQFAQEMQKARLATLVGQKTGGNQRGIDGGAFFFVHLPKSHVEVDLPIIGYYPPGNPPDAGLTPDVPTQPTAADIARGTDVEMEAVARLIQAGR